MMARTLIHFRRCTIASLFVAAMWLAACDALVAVPPRRAAPWEIDPFGGYIDDVEFVYPRELSEAEGFEPEESDEPLTAEQRAALELVQPYIAIEGFRRSPSGVLNLLIEKPNENAAPPDEDESAGPARLRRQLIAGDWRAVQAHLAELPQAAAPLVYSHVLNLLADSGMVQPEEIPAIAAASPGELTPQQLQQLGRLLKISLAHSDKPQEFLNALAAGAGGLGGQEKSGRNNAARLLLAAGMIDQAQSYLQPLGDGLEGVDAELLDLHAQIQMARLRRADEPDAAAATAWRCSLAVAGNDAAPDALRRAARTRAIQLMAKIPRAQASAWIEELFKNDPQRGGEFLVEVAARAEAAYAGRADSKRVEALTAASIVGETVLNLPQDKRENWLPALRLLAMPWINESLNAAGESKRLFMVPDDDEIHSLDGSSLAKIAPSQAWLAVLPVDAAAMARRLKARWVAEAGDWDALRAIAKQIAAYDAQTARDAVDVYLQVSQQDVSHASDQVNELMSQYQGQGYSASQLSMIRQQYMQQLLESGSGDGIALTRAKQEKSLQDLRGLLDQIDDAGLPAPSADALLEAFGAAHSSAEVYRREDIEKVFGPIDQLPPATALPLVETMRENLAQQWRDQRVQESAGTERSQSELTQEVLRGYDLAIEISAAVLKRQPNDVALRTTAGMTYFDKSELLYGLGADLPTYIATRDRAFEQLHEASADYAASLAERNELGIDVYLRWFQAALGASDLAYLTRQDAADKPQIEKLAKAIASLPPPMADKHLALFGEALTSELDSIPPSLKPRCLREALTVLGDHSAGEEARALLAYYEELLQEVHLHLEIDGPDVVGRGQPFGARLSVRYSGPLGREADHFAALLSRQSDSSGDVIDNKEKLEEEIREKLSEGFDIQEIRFHSAPMPRGYGRTGWSETPLAYLVLAAKDPAIDTIPSLQVDVQFRDGHGSVLLPIASQSLLIDARHENPPPRPVADVAVKQLLDARQLDEGKLRLEVVAEAVGLIPELEQVVRIDEGANLSGFRVDGIEDHGVTVLEFDTSEDAIRPRCERTWIIDMSHAGGAVSVVEEFAFPAVASDAFAATYEVYDDADIVACERIVPLEAHYALEGRGLTTYIVAALAAILGLGALVVLGLRLRRGEGKPMPYGYPSQLTPFSLVAFLRRVQGDDRLRFADRDREILADTITELEDRYFSRGDQAEDDSELQEVLDDWLYRAQRHLAASNGHR